VEGPDGALFAHVHYGLERLEAMEGALAPVLEGVGNVAREEAAVALHCLQGDGRHRADLLVGSGCEPLEREADIEAASGVTGADTVHPWLARRSTDGRRGTASGPSASARSTAPADGAIRG